jgi:hypothetical protein
LDSAAVKATGSLEAHRYKSAQIRRRAEGEVVEVTPLNATLTNTVVDVDSKRLTVSVNPLDATLTKFLGGAAKISIANLA